MKNIHEIRESELNYLLKELCDLRRARYNLGQLELDKPIRDGWIKYLVLRKDISKRKDAYVFQDIIDVCGLEMWGRTKKKLDKDWDRMLGRSQSLQLPGLAKLDTKKFDELNLKTQLYFRPVIRITRWGYELVIYHCIAPMYYFEEAYRKSYITHMHILDPKLNKRIDEIENKLSHPPYYNLRQSDGGSGIPKWLRNLGRKNERRKVRELLNIDEADQLDERRMGDVFATIGWLQIGLVISLWDISSFHH